MSFLKDIVDTAKDIVHTAGQALPIPPIPIVAEPIKEVEDVLPTIPSVVLDVVGHAVGEIIADLPLVHEAAEVYDTTSLDIPLSSEAVGIISDVTGAAATLVPTPVTKALGAAGAGLEGIDIAGGHHDGVVIHENPLFGSITLPAHPEDALGGWTEKLPELEGIITDLTSGIGGDGAGAVGGVDDKL